MLSIIGSWLMGEKIIGNGEHSKWSILGLFTMLFSFVAGIIESMKAYASEFYAVLDQFISQAFESPSLAMLPNTAVINAFIPLSESIVTYSAVFTLWIVFIVIRLVKSLIPTASN